MGALLGLFRQSQDNRRYKPNSANSGDDRRSNNITNARFYKLDEPQTSEETSTAIVESAPTNTSQNSSSENYGENNSNTRNKNAENSTAHNGVESGKRDTTKEDIKNVFQKKNEEIENKQSKSQYQKIHVTKEEETLNDHEEKYVPSNDDGSITKDSLPASEYITKENNEINSSENIENQRGKNQKLMNDKEDKNDNERSHVSSDNVCFQEQTKNQQDCNKKESTETRSNDNDINGSNDNDSSLVNHENKSTVTTVDHNEQPSSDLSTEHLADKENVTWTGETKELNPSVERQQDCNKNESTEARSNDDDINGSNDIDSSLVNHENKSTVKTVDHNEQPSSDLSTEYLHTLTGETKELNPSVERCTEIKKDMQQDLSRPEKTTRESKDNEDKGKVKGQSKKKNKANQKGKSRKDTNKIEILDLQSQLEDANINKLSETDDGSYIIHIKTVAQRYEEQVKKYSGTNYSVDYFLLDEKLMRLIEKLDRVKCYHNEELLAKKIEVVNYIKGLQSELDRNAQAS